MEIEEIERLGGYTHAEACAIHAKALTRAMHKLHESEKLAKKQRNESIKFAVEIIWMIALLLLGAYIGGATL